MSPSQLLNLSKSELENVSVLVERERLRRSLKLFGREAFPHVHGDSYVHGRHFDVLIPHLEAVVKPGPKQIKRLLINKPPAVGKSYWTSQIFVPWVWTWWPSCRFLYFSYSTGRATKDSQLGRDLIKSKWYSSRWGSQWQITRTDDSKTFYTNSAGGWRMTSYPGGQATGEHPDVIVVDDPISADDVNSRPIRQEVKKWYFETLSTRGIGRGAAHIISQQRLHVEDLSGHIIDFMKKLDAGGEPNPWHHVCLPMRYDPEIAMPDRGFGGEFRTQVGELLYPELLGEATVRSAERALSATGPWAVDAQFGQKPTRRDGSIFKCSKIRSVGEAELPIYFDRIVRFWDFAGTEGAGCYTAGALVGMKGEAFYLLDVQREQLNGDDVETLVENTARMDRALYGDRIRNGDRVGTVETYFEREPGSSGLKVAQILERKWRALNILSIAPSADKITRAGPLASIIRDGLFYLLEGQAWEGAWLDEMEKCPGTYMDQVDATAGAVLELIEPTHKSKQLVIASGKSTTEAALAKTGKCKCGECKRPAFEANGYCCSECKRTFEAGEVLRHTPQCAHAFNDWWIKNS